MLKTQSQPVSWVIRHHLPPSVTSIRGAIFAELYHFIKTCRLLGGHDRHYMSISGIKTHCMTVYVSHLKELTRTF